MNSSTFNPFPKIFTYNNNFKMTTKGQNCNTGIPQFTLLMWRLKKKAAETKTA